jgi:hypothetical protein
MMRPAINSTDDPPVPIHDLHLREYVFALRRRIEVGQDLMEALSEDIRRLKQERDGLQDQLSRVLIDLHWYEAKRNMDST